jgi:hypothetical protein
MRNWLVKNLPWIFSGIGIVAIAVTYKFIKWLLRKRKNSSFTNSRSTAQTAVQAEPVAFAGPDPFEIVRVIGNAPLLQQDEIAKHYIGIPVDCIGKLRSIQKTGGDILKLQISVYRKNESVDFFFEVNSANYPGIGLLKAEDNVHVKGYIKAANPNWITLRDAKLI